MENSLFKITSSDIFGREFINQIPKINVKRDIRV